MRWMTLSAICACLLSANSSAPAAVYEVGPGQSYVAIGDVPWEALTAGDVVRIHWRSTPYREKWVICRQGTATAPIRVEGVGGPSGELPVISGEAATTRLALDYWSEGRGVIKIGGANIPVDTLPQHIIIEGLEVRSARPPYAYTSASGSAASYPENAAAIYVEKGEHITVRGCTFTDCGNGFFVASSDAVASRDILVQANYLYDNGIVGSAFHHNSYTAALGIVFEFNRYGPPKAGAIGNALKDRSAGLIVRYNWIEGGNRQLDLVDAEDSVLIRDDPSYATTYVYGNLLIEPDGAGNSQILHYGGDSGALADYRKGVLHFYHNTVVSYRSGNTTLARLSTNDESCDARNNILFVIAAGNRLALLDADGVIALRHNWLKANWVASHSGLSGSIVDDGTSIETGAPGFVDFAAQDFRLTSGAACIDAGTGIAPGAIGLPVLAMYVPHQLSVARPLVGPSDVGAYEFTDASDDAFVRGDCNDDAGLNIADAVYGLAVLFGTAPAPACDDACDINDDGALDIADPVWWLATLFAGGPPPPAPYSDCGVDRTAFDALTCDVARACP